MTDTRTRDPAVDTSDTNEPRPTTTFEKVDQFAKEFEAEFAHRLGDLDLARMPRLTALEPCFSTDPPTGETPPTGESPPTVDVRHNLIVLWADIAVRHAIVRRIADPDELVATVVGIPGAWGSGATPDEALGELHSVLIGWATLKLDDGDRDIPDMEGIRLVLDP